MARLTCLKPRIGCAPPRLKAAPKVAEPFYQSKAWLELKARRRLDSDYFAAVQRAKTDGSNGRVILDHVRERKDGGDDLDPANTQWLTTVEHNRKTARERAARAKGER